MADQSAAQPEGHQGLPLMLFETRAPFFRWLAKNQASTPEGIWLKFAKKNSGATSLSYEEAREVALIFGWIDGLKNALDASYYALRFTQRRARSKWSKINRDIVEQLIQDGLMKPPGLAQVHAAQADGRWEAAYPSAKTIEEPADFLKLLRKTPKAEAFYATISRTNRYSILYRIHDAKRPETRRKRIEQLVAMLARGETVH